MTKNKGQDSTKQTPEEMQNQLNAIKQENAGLCKQEILKVLEKYNCGINPTIVLDAVSGMQATYFISPK